MGFKIVYSLAVMSLVSCMDVNSQKKILDLNFEHNSLCSRLSNSLDKIEDIALQECSINYGDKSSCIRSEKIYDYAKKLYDDSCKD